MTKKITVDVSGTELRFEVSARDVEAYQDDVTMQKKVVPSKRLLKNTVAAEDRETLDGFLDAGYALEIAAVVMEEFQGDVKITVKKSSAG